MTQSLLRQCAVSTRKSAWPPGATWGFRGVWHNRDEKSAVCSLEGIEFEALLVDFAVSSKEIPHFNVFNGFRVGTCTEDRDTS